MFKKSTYSPAEVSRRYAAIRPHLGSFDIINCEHEEWFWRWIGHTAMVHKSVLTGQVNVYESTSRNKFSGISGVQLTPMRLWLMHYPGRVYVRRVVFAKDYGGGGGSSLEDHIKKYRGVPYPDLSKKPQRRFLFNAVLDLPFGIGANQDREDIMFCSHLVAHAWRWRNYYEGEWPSSEFQPDDTREGGSFERMLINGISLWKEIRLK